MSENIPEKLSAEEIVEVREEVGLSQEKLAQVLNVTQTTLSRWETGKSEPHPGSQEKLVAINKLVEEQKQNEEITMDEILEAVLIGIGSGVLGNAIINALQGDDDEED